MINKIQCIVNMRLALKLPFLATILWISSARALNSLRLDELAIFMPEVATDGLLLDTSSDSFASDLQVQWDLNRDVSAPYVICDASGSHGYGRLKNIASRCKITNIENKIKYNRKPFTCVDAQMSYADARDCAEAPYTITGTAEVFDPISVTPYTPWLKIQSKSVIDSLRNSYDANATQNIGTEQPAVLRYASYFVDEELIPKKDKKKYKHDAKEKLQTVWKDTAQCQGDFKETFKVILDDHAIRLYQREDSASVSHDCMLKLLKSFAANHFVRMVEWDPPVTISNNNGGWIMQGSVMDGSTMVFPMHEAGITGKDQVVQMSDTGVNVRNCYFYDSSGEVPRDKSTAVQSDRRKVVQYYAHVSDEDEHGHGTHCAGTILGQLCTDEGCSPTTDKSGIAFDAKIAVEDVGTAQWLSIANPDPMFVRGTKAGAQVHSASWGNSYNGYQYYDYLVDHYVYNRDSNYLLVQAAGNGGWWSTKNTVSGLHKNGISVCASLNKGYDKGEKYAAEFSSMGPSADGRIKPDICAPGKVIFSASNSDSSGDYLSRQCSHRSMSGTSMACPGVAGAALLLRQYFMEGYYPHGTKNSGEGFSPSAALIKAAILNSGRPMLGREKSNIPSVPYDESQGFGLISLVDAVYLKDRSKGKVWVWDNVEISNGEDWAEIILGSCSDTIRSITLVWTDPPGQSYCNFCLINQLELTAENDYQILHPNGRSSPDSLNNVQRIRIPNDGESFAVKVHAANLATSSQKFSVVVSGCEIKSCRDDPDFNMFENTQTTCSWIGKKSRRYKRYCTRKTINQILISDICCQACNTFS